MVRRRSLSAFVLLAAVASAQDELGLGKMWTFERPPLAYLEREYGFRPDQRWWNMVRLASLRFGRGCSASFVSPKGLILTNHHCTRGNIAQVQGDSDWVRDGFVARGLEDEVRLPGLTVQQLVRMTDVTAELNAGIDGGMNADEVAATLTKNGDALLARVREDRPEYEPQLVKLFQGGIWQLYEYRIFDDIRLVMAPHLQISHFGGDPDNFVYPRYAIDFAFCRAYVDGEPADTADFHLPWSDGPEQGELVFLTGNPGGTQRLLTKAQLEYERDARYPRVRALIDNRIEILRGFAKASPQREKELRTTILGLENGQKLYRGEHAALLDPAFMQRKEAAERAFQSRAASSGHDGARIWQRIAELMTEKTALEGPRSFHGAGGLPLLLRGLAMLEFAATGDERAAQEARDIVCRRDPVQEAFFADHWQRARDWLPADDPVLRAVLGSDEPEAATGRLVTTSRLGDAEFLELLLADGGAAIAESDDPALVIARVLRPAMAANRAAAAAIEAAEDRLGAELAGLLFEVYGNEVSPDATFTLRISDGRVLGYPYNGTLAPWRTSFHGLFARHAEFAGDHPFDLPDGWLLAKDRIDMQAPVDFVCTVDSTGGNSGSPVIDAHGRLVGLLFDGNIESLANEFLYGERVERSVCVHPASIVEALRKVYHAQRLLREIGR
ncbi:MAG: S46 family peptidase [Planctomycetes bacterium]|nr:S46 family peptidase [Planctomycetota bacterium]